jgi:CheY-like chemotaxis protein
VPRSPNGRKKQLRQAKPVLPPKPLILCIEDEPSQLQMRTAVLEGEGYEVVGVADGRVALREFQRKPFCCVITDHMLRGATGAELAQKMKRMKPDVPFVLHSGEQPERQPFMDVYINKGESTAEFLAIIRDLVRRSCGLVRVAGL